jgi:ribosome-associated translation inhibitor RaiA
MQHKETSYLSIYFATPIIWHERRSLMLRTHAKNFTLTGAIKRHIANSVQRALGRASRWIRTVAVRLRDTNGRRGGVDKACRMIASLDRRGPVVVETADRDLYIAIDAAATKLRKAVQRRLTRRRTLRRQYTQRGRR